MISSFDTSLPVSASTFAYLIRWPVFLLIWLKWIFSVSEVAGYKATGQVTRERRRKPFQLARGAMTWVRVVAGNDRRRSRGPPVRMIKLGEQRELAPYVASG